MRNISLSIIYTFIFLTIFSVHVNAIGLNPPNQGNMTAGAEIDLNIVAAPTASSNGVQVRLAVDNGTFISYTPPTTGSFGPGPIGECGTTGGGQFFTSTTVCFGITPGSTVTIRNGDILGTVRVKMGTSGTTTVSVVSGSQYWLTAGGTQPSVLNDAGIFVIGGDLPNTAFWTDGFFSQEKVRASGAGLLVLAGMITHQYIKFKKDRLQGLDQVD